MARKHANDPQNPIHRDNVPGDLDHASGQVDEFEAGIVSGAEGEPADPAAEAELAREAERALPAGAGRPAPVATKARRGPGAFPGFLRASWAELQRVQWPDRRQVAQATGVVLGFVIVAGAYLGLADAVAQRIVDAIL